jgi:hypothetical protein
VGSVVAKSPGKAIFVLISQLFEQIQTNTSRADGSVRLPSPVLALLDQAQYYHVAGNDKAARRCLSEVYSLVSQNDRLTDPLSLILKRLFDASGERSSQLNELSRLTPILLEYGSKASPFLETNANSEIDTSLYGTYGPLTTLSRTVRTFTLSQWNSGLNHTSMSIPLKGMMVCG